MVLLVPGAPVIAGPANRPVALRPRIARAAHAIRPPARGEFVEPRFRRSEQPVTMGTLVPVAILAMVRAHVAEPDFHPLEPPAVMEMPATGTKPAMVLVPAIVGLPSFVTMAILAR